jgi:hypothetical protein
MITEGMYLLAKKVVEEYEQQLKQAHVSGSLQQKIALMRRKRGDWIEYKGGMDTKNFQIGKKYRMTSEAWVGGHGRLLVAVINDNGQRYVTKADFFCCNDR